MLRKLTSKNIVTIHLLIFLICYVIQAEQNIQDAKSKKNSKEKSKPEGNNFREIRIKRKVVPDFHSIFDDLEKIRNLISVGNNMAFPYDEILFHKKKNHKLKNKVVTEKQNEETIKNLLQEPEYQSSITGSEMYNKDVSMLNNVYSNKKEAYSLLLNASKMGNERAKAEVAWGLMYGTHLTQNLTMAAELFKRLAEDGFPGGHVGIGFLHSLGLTMKVNRARALLHYTIAALGGNNWSRMILGYRNWFGITVIPNCEKALEFYRSVAADVASKVEPNGGPVVHRIRLLDEEEDSDYHNGLINKHIRDYYEMLAERGEVVAQIGLGQMYYRGSKGFPKDYKKALRYFQQAATNGNIVAIAYIGKIYLEGDDTVEVNLMNAYLNFKNAADQGNAIGQFGLGLMYLEGKYVEKNMKNALGYLSQSADQGWVESLVILGTMYLKGSELLKRDYAMARKYFILAAQGGNVLGFFNLAQMHSSGIGTMRSCKTAVELFKNVAERGKWGTDLLEAYLHYKNGRYSEAFVIYAIFAEMGYEVAQNNAAFLLDRGLFNFLDEDDEKRYVRARFYWNRSAMQGNALALIKLGDYHFYGLGTNVNYDAAVTYYKIASQKHQSPRALFNLGYMHEHGLGLEKDLDLAKRSYDLAAEASPDAEFPVLLALAKLHLFATVKNISQVDWYKMLTLRMLDIYFGKHWDIYCSGFLLGLAVYIIHLRMNRRDILRNILNYL